MSDPYKLVLLTSSAVPALYLDFHTPSDKMAIDYAGRVLERAGSAGWVMGGTLYNIPENRVVAEFATEAKVYVKLR